MSTRAERVKEALEHIEGFEKVAFALAINDVPLRRDYFNAVTGYDPARVVRVLARLANEGVVAETDGLLFQIASPEIGREVLSHLPDGLGRELHQASLDWARDCEDVSDRFLVHHLVGAGDFEGAARRALACRRAEEDLVRGRAWIKPLQLALEGLLQETTCDIPLCIDLGLTLVRDGHGLLKPGVVTAILSSLMNLDLNGEQLAEVAASETWLKEQRSQARAQARQAARQAKEAAQDEASEEISP